MKRTFAALAAVLLILAVASPALADPPAVSVSPGVVALGDDVAIDWTFRQLKADQSLWSRTDCIRDDDGSIGLTAYGRLDDPEIDTVTTGITPSWDGSPATCVVYLLVISNGVSHYQNPTASFRVE